MYMKIKDFDKNNKERIYNLLVLKGEALIKANFLALNQGIKEGEEYSNFFSTISNQIDMLVIYFINDEISASLKNRGPFPELIQDVLNDHKKYEDFKKLEFAKKDLVDLFANRTDFIIGSNFLDFKVSSFSTFEYYIDKLYDELIIKYPRSNRNENNLVKLLDKYKMAEDDLDRINIIDKIKKISFYVSTAEKINYVFSKCAFDNDKLNEYKDFINFYRAQRNTVHNLGIHKGKTQSCIIDGIEKTLENGKPFYCDNFNSDISECKKLMDIYEDVLFYASGIRIF